MSATAKDFIAEAKDINDILVPNLPAIVVSQYVVRRCDSLEKLNERFDRDKFTLAALGLS